MTDWVLKELLMQYRLIIHGDIDTFMKLRKRLISKIPKGYFGLQLEGTKDTSSIEKTEVIDEPTENKSIHVWAPKGIWQ